MINFLIFSGFFLAISGSAICLSILMLLNLPIELNFLIIPFLIIFSSYHINRKAELEEDLKGHKERTLFLRYNSFLDIFAILSYVAVIIIVFARNIESGVLVLIPPIIVFLYSVISFPTFLQKKLNIKRLKEIPLVKNLSVGLTWAVGTFLAGTYYNIGIPQSLIILAGFVYLRHMINTVTFDIRDVGADRVNGVTTLPVLLGVDKTVNGLHFLNAFSSVYILFFVFTNFLPVQSIALSLFGIYGFYFLEKARKKQNLFFLCDVIIDGEYLLWPFAIFFFFLLFP